MGSHERGSFRLWRETHDEEGRALPSYAPLTSHFEGLSRRMLRGLDERLEATLREMGVTFGIARPQAWNSKPWTCDLLPQIFSAGEWELISRALTQRLRAFELFLRDIHGPREILKEGILPVQPVLGSPWRHPSVKGLPLAGGAFLHLAGAAICRLPDGRMAFKHHYFSNASGIAYMMQNRRALARVIPQSFGNLAISPLAGAPGDILDHL
ncbi:MAG: circularly permuted type 2 ATP-grasp protein, partial [Terrimicrobiaceae bacterium]|nr:circularly permuted type 2 ATP-grasp protein [Terrimicrobiaceae bacterium]